MSKRKLLIIELNEFNFDYLKTISEKYNLINFKKLLKANKSITYSKDQLEHQGLDPWVQWVSVHTGLPSKIHQVKRLGSVPNLKFPQIWETFSKKGITTGIWGAMNASRNNAKNCLFFVPDPWTFSEKAFPKKLNKFLDFPRYYSKNYLAPTFLTLFIKSINLISFIFESFNIKDLSIIFRKSLSYIFHNGLNNSTLFGLYDLISVNLFILLKKQYKPSLSIIFLNSLAHNQHHHWHKNKESNKIISCMKLLDFSLGRLLETCQSSDGIILFNALGQKNVDGEKYCIYRQIDTKKLLKRLKINYIKFEEGMTNDVHIFFENSEFRNDAYKILSKCKIKEKNLFYVELEKSQSDRLFFQINYYETLEKNSYFEINFKKIPFFNYFSLIRERTGSHVREGNILSKNISIPKEIYNHDLNKYILEFFFEKKTYKVH